MKRFVISALIIVFTVISYATLAIASKNEFSIRETIKSFLRYDFKTVKEIPDTEKDSIIENSNSKSDSLMIFEPVNVSSGWLFDLSGGESLGVSIGTLAFDDGDAVERYIDIKGKNGEVRLLNNSFASGSEYSKTLFWSAKQQDGASIVKGSIGEVKCAVLFKLIDGSYCIYGYTQSDSTDFWSLELPKSEYFYNKANQSK